MRVHFAAAIVVLLAVLFLKVTPTEFALLALSILSVLCAEMFNTAIEAVVDLVSPDYHQLAKIAKDTAAGAVLITACGAGIMGYLILAKYVMPVYAEVLAMFGTVTDMGTIVSVLIVVIVVVIVKSATGTGTPPKIIRSDEIVAQMKQQMQQQQQMQQMAEMAQPMQQGAQAAELLSRTNVGGGGSMLDQMVGAA